MKFENCWMILPDHQVGFGTLEVAGDTISAVTLASPEVRPSGARLVLPGLVNCHGHTAMTLLRSVGGGLPLQRWLEEAIFPVEAKMTPEDVYAGSVWGIREMLAGGTTAVADMYDFPAEMARALRTCGMKGRVCRVGLNFVPGRLEDCVRFTRGWNKEGCSLFERGEDAASTRVQADLCIHSEYLTDEAFCRALADANRELRRPLHVHVSETEKEHSECLARHGRTPIAYLAETGLLDCGGYAAHCVHCTDDDFRIMAEKGVSLVHNPTSNMKLGSGFARIARAKELGVNVALGTDGCASNDNLNMFEEMHLASLIHKGLAKDPTVLPVWDVIDMATKNGARALGLDDAGEIAVGKKADLCVVDLDRPHLLPHGPDNIPSLVVHSMQASDVTETYVDGRLVYAQGKEDRTLEKNAFLAAVARLGCP